jgi:hypothetical protein
MGMEGLDIRDGRARGRRARQHASDYQSDRCSGALGDPRRQALNRSPDPNGNGDAGRTVARNVDVAERFKPAGSSIDQAGGIAVRLTSPDDYYIARANRPQGQCALLSRREGPPRTPRRQPQGHLEPMAHARAARRGRHAAPKRRTGVAIGSMIESSRVVRGSLTSSTMRSTSCSPLRRTSPIGCSPSNMP